MRRITIAAAQFENRNADKRYNLERMRVLTAGAVERGAEVVSFHEGCVTGYTFLRRLKRRELSEIAENIPEGPSTREIVRMSAEFGVPLLAGLLEKDGNGKIFNSYICADRSGVVAKHRKLHAFLNPEISSGDRFTVFELKGCKCGILICYDNNLPENVRVNALMGAEIVFAPHVTCCLPSGEPGSGLVDRKLWESRNDDSASLAEEFAGPKGRQWLLKWLPARAWENGIYVVFTNPVGIDDDQVRNGNAMIIDPFGEIIAECRAQGDGAAVAVCGPEKTGMSLGRKFLRARRPGLYGKLVEEPQEEPVTEPGWDVGE